MAKKIKLEVTEVQLTAIVSITDTLKSLVGTDDEDFNKESLRLIKTIDRMLMANGYKRKFS